MKRGKGQSKPSMPLFERTEVKLEELALYALGDFQARKNQLAGRQLPLDRLLGAFRRAATEKFDLASVPDDEEIAKVLEKLGAKVKRLPNFRAKHPFLILVEEELANQALEFFEKIREDEPKDAAR
jgi:hypothetical protein